MRKYIALLLSFLIFFNFSFFHVSAISYLYTSDDPIETQITTSYIGRTEAPDMIRNLQFDDVNTSHWAKEAITRLGALDIIKGFNFNGQYLFEPERNVTNEEALAFIIRALGLEANAQQEAINIANAEDTPQEIFDLWSRGYLVVANQIGLINANELQDALSIEQDVLDPEINFIRSGQATREQVAEWVVKGVNSIDPTALLPISGQQRVYDFDDWQDISPTQIANVEAVLVNNIMSGFPNGTFRPQGTITRAEMAQTLKNMDEVYYNTQNISKKTGIVVDIQDLTELEGTKNIYSKKYLILTEEGTIEEVTYSNEQDNIGQRVIRDVVVYRNKQVTGLDSVLADDVIEYLIDRDTSEMLYINDLGKVKEQTLEGILQPLKDIQTGYIVIEDANGGKYKLKLARALYGTDFIHVDGEDIPLNQAPIENRVELTIANGIVIAITYVGQEALYDELTGVVTDINANLGYITIVDGNGQEITKNYYKNAIIVEKQQYYEDEDEVGYYDQVFPYFGFDPLDTDISDVEAGDTVTMRLDDEGKVSHLFARANYSMYYGKVEFIVPKGALGTQVHLLLEDYTRVIIEVPKDTPVFKSNQQVGITSLLAGDWIKVLVNRAVIQPGYEITKVKEMIIDDVGFMVMNIYSGQVSRFNDIQNTMYLQDATTLSKMGWVDYQTGKTLTLSDDVEYYHNDERVSKDYIEHFLGYNGIVYVAVKEYYGNEQVKKVTYRDGKDQVLDSNTVTYSNGVGKFMVDHYKKFIQADDGTIIVRNGRLVNEQNIMVPDYTQVVLNGSKAAVVDITQPPITDNIKIYRVRIASIDEVVSFTGQSHSELNDMTWSYSPVGSTYTIDYYTKFIDDTGVKSLNDFIDYTEDTKADEVYTVFVRGNHAEYIVTQPYVQDGVRGEIYKIDGDQLFLRDTYYYDQINGSWNDFSAQNVGSEVQVQKNCVIIKNGEYASVDDLERGDKIRVMTDENLMNKYINSGGTNKEVNGFIIFVEG